MRILISALLVAACTASCPNDCNGNGVCNIYSACECYRNWMGADCSQRVCYFGHAFIDTPQGDLNSDGRVDRPDVFGVEMVSDYVLKVSNTDGTDSSTDLTDISAATAAQTAYAAQLTFSAGTYINNAAAGTASEVDNKGTVVVSATGRLVKHTDGKVRFGFTLPVVTTTGAAPTYPWTDASWGGAVYSLAIASSSEGSSGEYGLFNSAFAGITETGFTPSFCTGTSTVSATCTGTPTDGTSTCDLDASTDSSAACPAGCTETFQTCDLDASTDSTAACPAGCTDAQAFKFVGTGDSCYGTSTTGVACDLDASTDSTADCAAGCTSGDAGGVNDNIYVYPSQFSNTAAWERYPENHGVALDPTTTLKAFWDEAHFYAECSGKGLCDRDSGSCECFVGYEGEGCTRTSCPGGCSGHGVCSLLSAEQPSYTLWDAEKTQQCVCDPGYQGIDCAQRICPKGDDPITRPASEASSVTEFKLSFPNAWDAEFDAIDHMLPNTAGQVAEIQIFGYTANLDISLTNGAFSTVNSFALEFVDEFSEKWVTKTLDWRTASAQDVELALEALPNSVVQGVQVGVKYLDETATDMGGDASQCTAFEGESNTRNPCNAVGQSGPASDLSSYPCCGRPKVWSVTFSTNSGNVAPLGVRYQINQGTIGCTGTGSAGGTCANLFQTSTQGRITTCYGTATDGTSTCDFDSTTDSSASCPAGCTEDIGVCPPGCTTTTTVAASLPVDTDLNGQFETLRLCDASKSEIPCITADASGASVTINNMIELIGSDLLVQYDATTSKYVYATLGGSTDPNTAIFIHGADDSGTDDANPQPAFITEARQGTQENMECSNRGLCDYDTGLCKCFNGFTDDDCSVQNALAMY